MPTLISSSSLLQLTAFRGSALFRKQCHRAVMSRQTACWRGGRWLGGREEGKMRGKPKEGGKEEEIKKGRKEGRKEGEDKEKKGRKRE